MQSGSSVGYDWPLALHRLSSQSLNDQGGYIVYMDSQVDRIADNPCEAEDAFRPIDPARLGLRAPA